ncbi:MAG TPA: phage major capsid protein [Methylibium sp.]|uniref:phage major capsid protein n=1 Tax=Methylibium sp. TaxID=2067992 RepID=UPI002DB705A6|nr:phage major capsid protein [Methylibium sp.]HEU4459701.1 phage major capsid protein [Methylibium sp.]
MSKLSELRLRRDELSSQANALNGKYPSDKRMPIAEAEQLDSLLEAIEKVDAEIVEHSNRAQAAVAGFTGKRDSSAMRTPEAFRKHYLRAGAPTRADQDMSLTDFVRGIAGLPTVDSVKAALTVGTDTAGGHMVPSILMPRVLEALVPVSSVLTAGASIVPMEMGAKSYTLAALDTIPTAAWRAESGNVAQSDPTFRAVVAAPKSLAFYFRVSRELLMDASEIDAVLTLAIAQSFARELDRVALRGSGTSPEPRGILNTTNVGAVTNGTNGAALTGYANFFSAMQTILQQDAQEPTAAIMSPRSLVKLAGLLDSTNQPLQIPPRLQTMKMIATSQVPNNLTVGSSTDCSEIYIGDFTRLKFAMREQLSLQKLDQAFATTGEIGMIGHMRADVMIEYPKAFAVVTGVRP